MTARKPTRQKRNDRSYEKGCILVLQFQVRKLSEELTISKAALQDIHAGLGALLGGEKEGK